MNNKTIANLLKTVVKESQKEEVVWEYDRLLGVERCRGRKLVIHGDTLKLGVETIIAMLENVEESEG